MTDDPTCGTCLYADPAVLSNVDGGPDAVLLCRRHPPAMVGDDTGGYGPVWPIVDDSNWCGEHTVRPAP